MPNINGINARVQFGHRYLQLFNIEVNSYFVEDYQNPGNMISMLPAPAPDQPVPDITVEIMLDSVHSINFLNIGIELHCFYMLVLAIL
jgi:hypothetical protein